MNEDFREPGNTNQEKSVISARSTLTDVVASPMASQQDKRKDTAAALGCFVQSEWKPHKAEELLTPTFSASEKQY
jgi:hypothetical protein